MCIDWLCALFIQFIYCDPRTSFQGAHCHLLYWNVCFVFVKQKGTLASNNGQNVFAPDINIFVVEWHQWLTESQLKKLEMAA